jgi:PAS domain-containing protein
LRPVFARLQSVLAQVEVAGQAIIDRRELQQVIDSMPDSLLVLNQDGVVELANATSARRLGFGGPHEVVGLGLDALAGEVTPGWWQTLQADGAFTTRDVRLRSRTGNVVTFSAAARVFERVGSTRSAGVLVARESAAEVNLLTQELAATAERLEVSERFFQDLFDAMEDPITVLSPDFEILQANRQAKLVFGRDLIGRRCYRAFRMRDTPCENCPPLHWLSAGPAPGLPACGP